jgi:hypothetical protein
MRGAWFRVKLRTRGEWFCLQLRRRGGLLSQTLVYIAPLPHDEYMEMCLLGCHVVFRLPPSSGYSAHLQDYTVAVRTSSLAAHLLA